MIEHKLDTTNSILYIHPDGELEKEDFATLTSIVNPYIEQHGSLDGLIIDAPTFPGWDDFAAFSSHLRFVKDHQKHIKKIAVVTNSVLGSIGEHLVSHFVAAEIKHFPVGQVGQAKRWITDGAAS